MNILKKWAVAVLQSALSYLQEQHKKQDASATTSTSKPQEEPKVIIRKPATHVLRLYDYFENRWIDCGEGTYDEVLKKYNKATADGARNTSFDDGDYYKIFPIDTRMIFS